MFISEENLMKTAEKFGDSDYGEYYAEASALGWLPSSFPYEFDTDVGNGQPFVRTDYGYASNGDIVYVRYDQRYGCIRLYVYND